jgi:imidazolonepropionase
MAELEVLRDAALWMEEGRIAAVGPYREVQRLADARAAKPDTVEVSGVLFPGFVDCHTHAVFAGPRLDDHARRAAGATYEQIAAAGGGILESVRDLRACPDDELLELTRARLLTLLEHGSTTVEVKSGYGLALEPELKQLRVLRRLAESLPLSIVPTFLGAHAVPEEYRARRGDYVQLICESMIPAVVRERLAQACDVFCEPGAFTPEESRTILEAARRHGLALRLHADELTNSAGAELAAALRCASADHLAAVSAAGIAALCDSETVAVLLPATMMFLGRTARAPARALIDGGAAVALATDFNPGSSPTTSVPFVLALAVSQLGMSHAEAVVAGTVNAAAALGCARDRGQLAPGFRADVLACAVSDWREIAYWIGPNRVSVVWTAGSACPPPPAPLSLGRHVAAR